MVRRFVAALFAVGVVLGCWRFLGDGADLTDPQWLGNATSNVRELFGWSNETVRDRTDGGSSPSSDQSTPAPSKAP